MLEWNCPQIRFQMDILYWELKGPQYHWLYLTQTNCFNSDLWRSPLIELETSQLQYGVAGQFSSHSNSSCLSQASSGLNLNKLSESCQNYSSNESIQQWSDSQTNTGMVKTNSPQTSSSARPISNPQLNLNRTPQLDNNIVHTGFQPKNFVKLERRGLRQSSACSSVISSMESVDSSNISETETDSVTSGVPSSGPDTSCSSLDVRSGHVTSLAHNRMSKIISKLHILSPISDKSQVRKMIILLLYYYGFRQQRTVFKDPDLYCIQLQIFY